MTSEALALAIFDVDGTLIDSQDVILASMEHAFSTYEQIPPSREAVRRIVGLELSEAIARLAPDAEPALVAAMTACYKEFFAAQRLAGDGERNAPLYPGAEAALKRLAGSSALLIGAATGKARRGLDHVLEAHALAAYFTVTQTVCEAPGKPHPGMIQNCLSQTGVVPNRAVMIGDTTFDMEMAQNAGIAAIGVSWGYHEVAELRDAGAALIIDSYEALDAALLEILGPVEGLEA